MKLAVVGGGSTYTPELIDGFARLRDALPVEELVLVDPAADRLELVGGLARRIFAKQGHPGRIVTDDRPGRGRRRRRRGAAPAARRRPGRPQPGRDLAAGVRLRRPGDHRRGRARQGAAHRPGGPGHRRAGPPHATRTPGSSTSPTRSASSPGRCSRPGTGPSGCATWRSASSASSPRCSDVDPGRGRTSTTSGSTTSPGSGRSARRPGRRGRAAQAARRARRRDRRRPAAAARPCWTGSASSPPTTCATSTRTTRSSGAAAPSRRGPPRSPRSRSELLAMYARPGAGREAGAAGQARRRVLLGGRGGPGRRRCCGDTRRRPGGQHVNNGTLPFLPDDAVIEVPATVDAHGRDAAAGRAARAAVRRADRARHGVRGPGAGGRAAAAAGTGSSRRCSRTR